MTQVTQNKEAEAFLIELFRAFFSKPVRFRTSTFAPFRRRQSNSRFPACPPPRASGRQGRPYEGEGRHTRCEASRGRG
jgi:hypothetical protein